LLVIFWHYCISIFLIVLISIIIVIGNYTKILNNSIFIILHANVCKYELFLFVHNFKYRFSIHSFIYELCHFGPLKLTSNALLIDMYILNRSYKSSINNCVTNFSSKKLNTIENLK